VRSHMQPHSPSNPHISDQLDNHIQQIIPWWSDLSPAAREELVLSTLYALPTHTMDVIVIGAGVAGLSAALGARAAGAEVIVLETEPLLGYGATGRNAGILSSGVNMNITELPSDSPGLAFWPETHKALLSLIEEARQPDTLLSASLTGAISLARSKNAAHKQEREARIRQSLGLRAELWTAAQAAEQTQGRLNTEGVEGTLWLPDEGRIHPLTLLAHLAKKARAAGVVMFGQAHVTTSQEIQSRAHSYWQLTLADGQTISAHSIIRTVGPTVEPNARIYALAFDIDLPDTFPLFWDASPYTYADFRPGNGRLGVSGGRYGKAGVTKKDRIYHQKLADMARHWLPELQRQEPSHTWAVDLEVTANMIPTMRSIGKKAYGVEIVGLGSLGVLPGIVLGRRAGNGSTTPTKM
ncbi:MAG: FAD-binding oxidoreductase, partial [Chloroflexota bacterium]|nr:FAD-binding oxidoreductase [Chloroflexota bacterium]